jgi:hypothetical protein
MESICLKTFVLTRMFVLFLAIVNDAVINVFLPCLDQYFKNSSFFSYTVYQNCTEAMGPINHSSGRSQ